MTISKFPLYLSPAGTVYLRKTLKAVLKPEYAKILNQTLLAWADDAVNNTAGERSFGSTCPPQMEIGGLYTKSGNPFLMDFDDKHFVWSN